MIVGSFAVASAILFAGAPAPAQSTPAPHYAFNIGPTEVKGAPNSDATFTAANVGTITLRVSVSAWELRPAIGWKNSWISWKPFGAAEISPVVFTLHAGEKQAIHVVMKSTDGLKHVVKIAAKTTLVGYSLRAGKTGASLSPSVEPIYVLSGAHNPYATPVNAGRPIPVATPSDALTFASEVAGACAFAALCVALVWWRLRKHSRSMRHAAS